MIVTPLLLLFAQCILASSVLYITEAPPAPSFSKAKLSAKSKVVRCPTLRKVVGISTRNSKFADSTDVIRTYTEMARELGEEEKDLYLIKTKPINVEHALELFVHEAWLYQQAYVAQAKVLKEMNANPQAHPELAAHFAESGTDIGQVYFKARQAIAWSNVLIRFAGWISRRPRVEDFVHLDRLFEIVYNLYRKDLDLALEDVLPLFLNVPEFFQLRDNSSFFTWLVVQVREICNPPPPGPVKQKIWLHDSLTPSLLFYGAASHILLPFIFFRTSFRVAYNFLYKHSSREEFNRLQAEALKIALAEKRDKPAFDAYEIAWDKLCLLKGFDIIADYADESVTDEHLKASFLDPFHYTWPNEFLHVQEGITMPLVREEPKLNEVTYERKGSKSKGKKKKITKKTRKAEGKDWREMDPSALPNVLGFPPTFNLPSFVCVEVTDKIPIHVKEIQSKAIQLMEEYCDSLQFRWFWAKGKLYTVGYDTRLEKKGTLAWKAQTSTFEVEAKSEDKKAKIDELTQQESETVAKELKELDLKGTKNPVRQTSEAGPSSPITDDKVTTKNTPIPADEINKEKAEVKEEEEEEEEEEKSSSSIEDEGQAEWEHHVLEKKKETQRRKVFRQQQIDQENSKRRERVRNNMRSRPASSSSHAPTEVARLDSDSLCLAFSDAHNVFLSNKNVCSINAKGFSWHFDPKVVIKQSHMDFLCSLFDIMPGRSLLKFKKMVKVYWAIERQLNKKSVRKSTIAGTKVFKWSHQFQINNTLVSPVMMEIHPEHESSGFNHAQARALFSGGGFDPRFFSPQ